MSGSRLKSLFKSLRKPIYADDIPLGRRAVSADEVEITSSWKIEAPGKTSAQVRIAIEDLKQFLEKKAGIKISVTKSGTVSSDTENVIMLILDKGLSLKSEAYRISCDRSKIAVSAGDESGLMYGIFHLEEIMKINDAPVVNIGVTEREPVIKTRILRSPMAFYYSEELLNINQAYPESYLLKMAHHGINGIWLRGILRDLARTDVFPELGQNSDKLLAQLNKLVRRCAKYGIKVYLYFTEPLAFEKDSDFFKEHPHLKGEPCDGQSSYALCTATGR
jgi:alpha-glucuronidase